MNATINTAIVTAATRNGRGTADMVGGDIG